MICSATNEVIKIIGRMYVKIELKGCTDRDEVSSIKEGVLRNILVKNLFACICG